MIETAAILSLVVHHGADRIIICVPLTFTGVVGFRQEHKADNAVAQHKKNLVLHAHARPA
jgi:H+-transporting ATPase